MRIQLHILLLAVFCAAVESKSQGTLRITFDGPPALAPGTGVVVTNYYESGMLFKPLPGSYGFSRYGPDFPSDPQDGTAFLKAALGDSLMFSLTNGSFFDVISVDLAEYSTVFSNEPVTVPFIGYQQGGSTVTNYFTTDGLIDGTGPLPDFQTFYFTNFTDLTRVEIPSYLWSLDNLVVSVPEPGPGALLLFGALALGAWKWRHPRRE